MHAWSNAEIADELFLATSTVKTYVSRLLSRLDQPNRAALAALAHEWGLVDQTSHHPDRPKLIEGSTEVDRLTAIDRNRGAAQEAVDGVRA